MLIEGVVDIPPQEEKAIDSMLKDLERFHKKRSTLHKDASNNAICAALKQHTNEFLAPKYGLDFLFWRFIYDAYFIDKAGYVPKYNELFVNLAYDVSDMTEPLRTQKINWDTVAQSIYHEWTHVKQDDTIKKKYAKGMMTPKLWKMNKQMTYHDSPWEQMAFARQEIEWIRRNLKRVKPQHVIKWLQKQGLKGPETAMLKIQNPEAYKKILKYAVMFMLKKLAQKATQGTTS